MVRGVDTVASREISWGNICTPYCNVNQIVQSKEKRICSKVSNSLPFFSWIQIISVLRVDLGAKPGSIGSNSATAAINTMLNNRMAIILLISNALGMDNKKF